LVSAFVDDIDYQCSRFSLKIFTGRTDDGVCGLALDFFCRCTDWLTKEQGKFEFFVLDDKKN
jgi:hypothetical protein